MSDTVDLASFQVGSTVARKTTFNPGKHRRGFGGRFAVKGKPQADTATLSSKVNSLQVGESIELPGGKGWLKRLANGYQVVKGDGTYNKVYRDASDAVSEANRLVQERYGQGVKK